MNETTNRMIEPGNPPSDFAISDWVGKKAYKYWKNIAQHIGQNYRGVFNPERLFGGRKHGWSLR